MDLEADRTSAAPSKLRTTRLPLWVTLVAVGLLVAAVLGHFIAQRQTEQRQGSAVMRNNFDEIGQHSDELVKDRRIRLVLLTDANGKVLLPTDRSLKESAFSQRFPATVLNERTVAIHPGEGQLKRLVMLIQRL